MENNNIEIPNPKSTDIFIATIGEMAKVKSFKILKELRTNHISADADHLDRSMKAQFKYSDKINAKFTIVIGDDELANDSVTLKDMAASQQTTIKLSEIVTELKNRL
ncbi:Histidine--tRNA ligase [bioreactor metagenome]|uniref:Histidine--tRNA ligase n=2 Tax=root TaxID=1 RepID=A0A645BE23_9ZZZZ